MSHTCTKRVDLDRRQPELHYADQRWRSMWVGLQLQGPAHIEPRPLYLTGWVKYSGHYNCIRGNSVGTSFSLNLFLLSLLVTGNSARAQQFCIPNWSIAMPLWSGRWPCHVFLQQRDWFPLSSLPIHQELNKCYILHCKYVHFPAKSSYTNIWIPLPHAMKVLWLTLIFSLSFPVLFCKSMSLLT